MAERFVYSEWTTHQSIGSMLAVVYRSEGVFTESLRNVRFAGGWVKDLDGFKTICARVWLVGWIVGLIGQTGRSIE